MGPRLSHEEVIGETEFQPHPGNNHLLGLYEFVRVAESCLFGGWRRGIVKSQTVG